VPFLKGDEKQSPRKEFVYWSDDGDLMAIRVQNWKMTFMEQNNEISPKLPAGPWMGQFTKLRSPKVYNLRSDPFERGPDSGNYFDWMAHRMFLFVPAQAAVSQWLESFKDFPPRTKPASFSVSDVMDKIATASANKN
jgi:hypothetical protein